MNKKSVFITLFLLSLAIVIVSAGSIRGAAEKCTPNLSSSGPNTMDWSCSKPNNCTNSGSMTTSEPSATKQATCDLFGKIFPSYAGKNITGGKMLRVFYWQYFGSISQEYSDETDITSVILRVKENNKWGVTYCFSDNNESYCFVTKKGTWSFNGSDGGEVLPVVDLLVGGALSGAGGAINVPIGESAVLKWSSNNSASCSATGGVGSTPAEGAVNWNGSVDLNNSSNSKYVYTINDDNIFGIRCCDAATPQQCANDEVTILAGTSTEPIDPNLPSCDFGADPSSIIKGEKSTLSWTCQNADDCTLKNQSGFPVVNFPPASTSTDSHEVSPSKTRTYTLKCSNSHGSRSYDATVDVTGGGSGQFPNPNQREVPPGN